MLNPAPPLRFNYARQLHGTLRPQRRLFAGNLEDNNAQEFTSRGRATQDDYINGVGPSMGAQYEGRHFDDMGLSGVPYNQEGSHEGLLGPRGRENSTMPMWELHYRTSLPERLKERSFHIDDTSAWKPDEISKQQWKVLEAISQGKSVFVTGSAGTGKSYLLKYAIKLLKELHDPLSIFVTASTGIAACHLRGRTLHSFAGVQLEKEPASLLAARVENNIHAKERWCSANVLVIDEISMISGEFWDKLEYIARKARGNKLVFGGLQLIVTGDFFQLPPVKPTNPRKQFAFEADCWNKCFYMQIELKEVFRQVDGEFVRMLEEIRKAQCSARTITRLRSLIGQSRGTDSNGIVPTRLFPVKVDVRKYNDRELMALNKEIVPFIAKEGGPEQSLLDCGMAPKELYLCEGAQVMLISNLDVEMGLVNGARGVVVGFSCSEMRESRDISPKGLWPVVKFHCLGENMVLRPVSWEVHEKDCVLASRSQVPLILAWAVSVHKGQGSTLDRVETDISKAFEYGMVYVALSRVKSLEGLRLIGFDPEKIKAHPKVFDFYERLHQYS